MVGSRYDHGGVTNLKEVLYRKIGLKVPGGMEEQGGGEATVLNPPGAWKNVSKISSGGFTYKILKKVLKN